MRVISLKLQPRAHGSLSVILVSLWVAEVDQHPVNKPAKATHGLSCRAHKVREHHRDVAPLGSIPR
jgi:hypothetical protein